MRVVMRRRNTVNRLGVTLGVTILIVVSTLLASAHENDDDETQLVLVQIVFRHGDRTPVGVYPTDPNNASVWKKFGGLGQLTQRGMQQHYAFGRLDHHTTTTRPLMKLNHDDDDQRHLFA